jgi:hypothetical protein
MKNKSKLLFLPILLVALSFIFNAGCKKENDANFLGGETNIPLTQVGVKSSLVINIGNYYLPDAEMTVISNDNGVVTYHAVIDLTGSDDSALIAGLVPNEYKDAQGRINTNFKFKITSEGIQDYFQSDKPWTVVKYNDPVGTNYDITNVHGDRMRRTVTEKTGTDDFPYGWLLIKTSKVEQNLDPSDNIATKITYRANHRFGLVFMEVELKGGATASIYVFPQGI